jgi:hypothetical protein
VGLQVEIKINLQVYSRRNLMEEKKLHPLTFNSLFWQRTGLKTQIDWIRLLFAWRSIRTGLLLWLVFAIFMALVQFSSPDLADNDGYYHIKLAYLMRTEGIKPEFSWLPLSILNPREFYDHHFLFHTALIPFTFGDLRTGAKWAAVLFASLAFLSVFNLLRNQRVNHPGLWALGLLAISEAFIFRMSIPRAQSLSLAVLMLGLDWMLRERYTRLILLAFVYVWMYDAFPLLLAFAGIYSLVNWLFERRLNLYPILFVAAGIGLGLVINPYFPHDIVFAVHHILPKLFDATTVNVGSEWYPYTTDQLIKNSPLALAAFLSGTLALGLNGKQMDRRTMLSFCLACLAGFMLFQSRRFIEYFPPFALVFAIFAWTPVFERFAHSLHSRWQRWLPALILAVVYIPGLWLTFNSARSSMQNSKPFQTYAAASAWLEANTPEGARVFQTDWDDFPRLFYYNTHNTYLIGLDPTYMRIYNAELYQSWVDITQGKVRQPSTLIWQDFGAHYILTDLLHKDFLKQAAKDPGLVEVYRDGDAVVFQSHDTGLR